jgi:hypothetical protein
LIILIQLGGIERAHVAGAFIIDVVGLGIAQFNRSGVDGRRCATLMFSLPLYSVIMFPVIWTRHAQQVFIQRKQSAYILSGVCTRYANLIVVQMFVLTIFLRSSGGINIMYYPELTR